MQHNTPPHEEHFSDYSIGDDDELIEIEDEDQLWDMVDGSSDENEDSEMVQVDQEGDEKNVSLNIISNHKGSVFCTSLCPTMNVGASGGEDDLAFVWDTNTGELIFKCTGHKDSVTCVEFSHDGQFLASADMSGFIQVWNTSSYAKIWEFDTDDINWLFWHPSSTILFGGTINGEVWMWLIPRGDTKLLSQSGTSAECGALSTDGKHIYVAYSDGSVKIIDLKSSQTLRTYNCHSHEITSLSVHPSNTLILTGSVDGNAKISNITTGTEVACLKSGFSGTASSSEEDTTTDVVEVVSICPSIADLAVTANLSGIISIWNISAQTARHHIVQGCGTSSIRWIPDKPLFFTSGLDGILRLYDARSGEQLLKFCGHRKSILWTDIKNDGSQIATSSDDGTVRILQIADLIANYG